MALIKTPDPVKGRGVFSYGRFMENLFLNRVITPKADKTRE